MWVLLALAAASHGLRIPEERAPSAPRTPSGVVQYPEEVHLANVRQLTFGGSNAEAYFSSDSSHIVFQAADTWGAKCDQIFLFDLKNGDMSSNKPENVSQLMGSNTCSYFVHGTTKVVIYASTYTPGNSATKGCIPKKCPRSSNSTSWSPLDESITDICNHTYTWDIFPQFDIYRVDPEVYDFIPPEPLVRNPGYDAEATVSPDGESIVFTSIRSGDLELWIMDKNGQNQTQVTTQLGYDGGAFFAPDGLRLVYRASRPKTPAQIAHYNMLLSHDLVSPTAMELYLINADGTNETQITALGGANWAPFFHPNNKDIIFSTNHHAHGGFNFNLFMIGDDGSCRERITFDPTFDAFPMFSPDGTKLIFSSMRNQSADHEINLFIADWVSGNRTCMPLPTPTPTHAPVTVAQGGAGSLLPPMALLGALAARWLL